MQRKALLNSINSCSKKLKKHVIQRNILSRNKLPMGTGDLRKLIKAAGINCNTDDSVAVVSNPSG